MRNGDSDGQFAIRAQFLVERQHVGTRAAVADARDADRVVVFEQALQPLRLLGRRGIGGTRALGQLDVIGEVAQDSGGLARGIHLDAACHAFRDFEISVDTGEAQAATVERGIGTGAENDRMFRRGGVEFGARWIPLFAQARDKDLLHHNPFALGNHLRAPADVVEHV